MALSKLGLGMSLVFASSAAYFLATQGLFGESFVALLFGMPWVLAFVPFEFFGIANPIILSSMLLAPIALNICILYWLGARLARLF